MAGLLGGNIIGGLVSRFSLGTLANSLLGVIGAYAENHFGLLDKVGVNFGEMGTQVAGMDLGAVLNEVAGGAAGGGVLMIVIGIVKSLVSRG